MLDISIKSETIGANYMSKLMRGMQWAKREFSNGSIPDRSTLRRWVERGVIEGRVIDNKVYIFDSERAGLIPDVSKFVDELLRQ